MSKKNDDFNGLLTRSVYIKVLEIKMKVGWLSFHMVGLNALTHLLDQGKKIEAVITLTEDQRAKRSGDIDYTELCQKHNVPLYKVANINSAESIDLLKALQLDVVFVIGWSQIIKDEVLRIPRLGMIGVHSSLLPHNRGSAPINWTIIKSEKETGTTLMLLAPGVDTGDIIDQRRFPITLYDTCKTLYEKVADINKDMILDLYQQLSSGQFSHRPQPENTGEEVLTRRRPQDGLIDWSKSSMQIYDFIRALTQPYPGAFSFLNHKKWYIWYSAIPPEKIDIPSTKPGEIIGPVFSPIADACGIMIKCGHSALLVLELEDENGKILKGQQLSSADLQGLIFSNE
jgi:methionyl-tRNA formyltransferase